MYLCATEYIERSLEIIIGSPTRVMGATVSLATSVKECRWMRHKRSSSR